MRGFKLVLQQSDKKVSLRVVEAYNNLTNRQKRADETQTKKVFDHSLLTNNKLVQLIMLPEKHLADSSAPDLEVKDD